MSKSKSKSKSKSRAAATSKSVATNKIVIRINEKSKSKRRRRRYRKPKRMVDRKVQSAQRIREPRLAPIIVTTIAGGGAGGSGPPISALGGGGISLSDVVTLMNLNRQRRPLEPPPPRPPDVTRTAKVEPTAPRDVEPTPIKVEPPPVDVPMDVEPPVDAGGKPVKEEKQSPAPAQPQPPPEDMLPWMNYPHLKMEAPPQPPSSAGSSEDKAERNAPIDEKRQSGWDQVYVMPDDPKTRIEQINQLKQAQAESSQRQEDLMRDFRKRKGVGKVESVEEEKKHQSGFDQPYVIGEEFSDRADMYKEARRAQQESAQRQQSAASRASAGVQREREARRNSPVIQNATREMAAAKVSRDGSRATPLATTGNIMEDARDELRSTNPRRNIKGETIGGIENRRVSRQNRRAIMRQQHKPTMEVDAQQAPPQPTTPRPQHASHRPRKNPLAIQGQGSQTTRAKRQLPSSKTKREQVLSQEADTFPISESPTLPLRDYIDRDPGEIDLYGID